MEEKWYQYRIEQFGIVAAVIVLIPFVLFTASIVAYDSTSLLWLFVYFIAGSIVMIVLQYILYRKEKARSMSSGGAYIGKGTRNIAPGLKALLVAMAVFGFIFSSILPVPQSLIGWVFVCIGAPYLRNFTISYLTTDMMLLGGVGVAGIMFIVVGSWGFILPDMDPVVGTIYIIIGAFLLLPCIVFAKRVFSRAPSDTDS